MLLWFGTSGTPSRKKLCWPLSQSLFFFARGCECEEHHTLEKEALKPNPLLGLPEVVLRLIYKGLVGVFVCCVVSTCPQRVSALPIRQATFPVVFSNFEDPYKLYQTPK